MLLILIIDPHVETKQNKKQNKTKQNKTKNRKNSEIE